MGKRFELRTDHIVLKYLFEKPNLNARKIRWLEFLSEYDLDIKHIKGKKNKVVDALSRRVHLMHSTTVSMHQSNLKSRILDDLVTDLIQMDLGGHPSFPLNHHFELMVLINHDIHPFDGEWNVMSSSFFNYRHHLMVLCTFLQHSVNASDPIRNP
jgi:hypothetical protein